MYELFIVIIYQIKWKDQKNCILLKILPSAVISNNLNETAKKVSKSGQLFYNVFFSLFHRSNNPLIHDT